MKLGLRRPSILAAAAFALLGSGVPAAAGSPAPTSARPAAHPPAAPNCGAPVARPGGGTWTCSFDDEFSGSTLDRTKWVPVTSALSGTMGGPACYVDNPSNISVSNGVLNLTARKAPAPFTCSVQGYPLATQYTSGQVATTGKFSQTYGRFAVRAKFPATTVAGLQSSLWMWPQDSATSGSSGEIDIAEEYSQYADRAVPYLHYPYNPLTSALGTNTNIVTNNQCLIANVNAFHEYAIDWTPTTITVEYDGQTCLVDNYVSTLPDGAAPFNQPFFMVLTQALGIYSNAFVPDQTPLPATTQVDWVHIYK
jgi:beta-glucanase (GH16 family)